MKKLIISMLGLSILGLGNANEKTGDLKSSATMQATCTISTDSINFGVVATPLMSQTSQGEMNVLCSNASAYTIDLAYGGIYGQGGAPTDYTLKYKQGASNNVEYSISNASGVIVGSLYCGYDGGLLAKTFFSNLVVANIYGSTTSGTWMDNSIYNACRKINVPVGSPVAYVPNSWIGAYNASGVQSIITNSGYSYGVMNGMSKGDKLAYSIAVPGDPNKVWNKGNNSYKATGVGANQTIPLNAKIVPDKSGSKYPAPDMYLDTVTAVISY